MSREGDDAKPAQCQQSILAHCSGPGASQGCTMLVLFMLPESANTTSVCGERTRISRKQMPTHRADLHGVAPAHGLLLPKEAQELLVRVAVENDLRD